MELSKEKMNEANYNKRFSEWMDEKLNSSKKHLDLSSKFGPIDFLEDIPYPENPGLILRTFRKEGGGGPPLHEAKNPSPSSPSQSDFFLACISFCF